MPCQSIVVGFSILRPKAAGAVAIANSFGRPRSARAAAADPFVRLDGIAQAQAIAKGEATALELIICRYWTHRAIESQAQRGCYHRLRSSTRARQENKFKGPFAGVPYLVKDLADFAGLRTTKGSRAMLANIADATDTYVQACIDAGMNVVGKSNTPEFGMSCTTESMVLGPCYNPWNLVRSAGGSSGGAAAAVAAGMVPIGKAATAADRYAFLLRVAECLA